MKLLVSVLAIAALGLTLIPSFLVFTGDIDRDLQKKLMAIGAILWFIAAPIWFKKQRET